MKKIIGLLIVSFGLIMFSAPTVFAASGASLFKANCSMCHAINGQGGKMAPNLSHIGSKMSLSALEAKIPTMPGKAGLPKSTVDSIANYLESLK
jgi:mono/diheme cytochrome c family protein